MEREHVQSIVLQGSGAERHARCDLLTFGAGEARAVLARLLTDVSNAAEPPGRARRQLALSASGLRMLGLSEAELAQFSREFRQGMAHPERALALADVGAEGPELWEFGGPNTAPIDALWLTLCDDAAHLAELSAQYARLFARFGVSAEAQDATLRSPEPKGALASERRRWFKRVPWGELVLGERDAVGERLRGPLVPIKHSARPLPPWVRPENALDFGKNGSYLAVRKSASHWLMAVHTNLRHQFEFAQAKAREVTPRSAPMRGGGYFFLPSLPALNYLAESRG